MCSRDLEEETDSRCIRACSVADEKIFIDSVILFLAGQRYPDPEATVTDRGVLLFICR